MIEHKRNKFNFSHEHDTSLATGALVPVMCRPVLPGDVWDFEQECLVRAMPMIAPIFHRVNVYNQSFFVPMRAIWDDADEFFTRGRNRESTVTMPRIEISQATQSQFIKNSLAHYLLKQYVVPDIPAGVVNYVSALPFRAYQAIVNRFFKNLELQTELDFSKSSADLLAADIDAITDLCGFGNRNWERDYFTGAKYQANLDNDLTGVVPITGLDEVRLKSDDSLNTGGTAVSMQIDTDGSILGRTYESYISGGGVDIEDIRRVSAFKRFMEIIMRTGYRIQDFMKGVWNVISSDGRIQDPEYLGGMTQPLRISEVLNTSDTATAPQGQMSGHGLSANNGGHFRRTFEDYGFIITIQSIMPKPKYMQGVESFWFAWDHLDWPNPLLANLGAQEVLSREIYFDMRAAAAANNVLFAYQNQYADWKHVRDTVSGEFSDTLKYWHMGREFAVRPGFDGSFLSTTPTNRIFAVLTGHHWISQNYFKIKVLRKLPYFSVPQIY